MPTSQHQNPKSDIEIAQAAKMTPIAEIGHTRLGIPATSLEPYGHYKAKVSMEYVKSLKDRPNGKLILVTAITPTPAGEGKTTTTVGLTDALNKIGKKAMMCLREPSLGPSFGMKGGAAGGGYAQVVPMEDINLHFTGDFHAITSANNLLAAMLDNSIYWGNPHAHRSAPRHLAPRPRHERSGAARDCQLAGRRRQRFPARGRLRHHRGVGSDGDLLPRVGPERSAPPAGQHHRRLHARQETGARLRSEGAGRDDGAAERRAGAEPGADAGRDAGVHSRRAVREHRAWLQLGAGHHHGVEARRLCGDGSGLRRRPRRRKVPRHQVPQGGARAGLRGAGGHHPRAQDAWRREEGRSQEGRSGRARHRHEQPAPACRERAQVRTRTGGVDQSVQRRLRGRNRAGQIGVRATRRRVPHGRPLGHGRRWRHGCGARGGPRSPTRAPAS